MAIIRPIAAIVSAIVAGVLVGKENEVDNKPAAQPQSSCCASKNVHPHQPNKSAVIEVSIGTKLRRAFKYSTQNMIADTATWLLIGLFFAALIQTFVPGDFLAKWGSGLLAMTVMVLVSIPMYICATASTPIAAGLLLSGVSPGAVLVFMMAGPATNIATLGVVAKALGRRAVVAYLIGVIGTAFVAGWLTDYLVVAYGFNVAPMVGHEHQLLPDWLVVGSAILLALLMIRSYIAKLPINKSVDGGA